MSEGKIWYIALDTEQIGPLSEQEVRDEVAAGSIVGDVPIWRDGMEGWEAIASLSEFSDIDFPPADPENSFDIADVAGDSVDAFFADFDRSAPAGDDDSDDFLSASIAAATIAAPVASSATANVAQRSDDSVLFSLDELAQTTRKVSSAASNTTDGSGLIDLSALASTSSTLRPRAATSDDAQVATSAPLAAPIALAPPKKSAMPAIMLGVAALVIIGLVVVILFVSGVLGNKDETPPVADATTAVPADTGTAPAADTQAAVIPPTDAAAVVPEEEEPAAAEVAADAQAATPRADRDARRADARPEAERVDPKPAAQERPAAAASGSSSRGSSSGSSSRGSSTAPAASGSGDSVSAALAAIQGGSSAAAAPAAAGGDAGKTSLSDTDIRNTVRRYNRQVQECGGSEADAGTYRVSFTINPDGNTTGVSPQGGGTVGACVGRVVSGMRFPSHNGSARQLNYTFAIR